MVERARSRINAGMSVRSAEGERLGKVVNCEASGFMVEKGFLFPKDTMVPYERVVKIEDGDIYVSLTRAELGDAGRLATAATTAGAAVMKTQEVKVEETTKGAGPTRLAAIEPFGKAGEICVPLVEEEIVTGKRVEQVGAVRVRKEVITEEKQVTVPVMREVVRVERVSVKHDVRPEDRPFEEVSYEIPIREEHVTIDKHAVVHEELHVGKEIQQAEEIASASLRRERADVQTTGAVRRAEASTQTGTTPSMRPTGTGGR
jgi:uncharacterized protein (TIGR02271 family)